MTLDLRRTREIVEPAPQPSPVVLLLVDFVEDRRITLRSC
jgi:hypothetical protein